MQKQRWPLFSTERGIPNGMPEQREVLFFWWLRRLRLQYITIFYYLCCMKTERSITAYKRYFLDFMSTIEDGASKKIYYSLDMLKTQNRISEKFVKFIRDGIYELRAEHESNIYRIFFCFDEGNIVILFNGFQKKTQKIPEKEIRKAIELKNEYYGSKKQFIDKR
jgi:phage-related protein